MEKSARTEVIAVRFTPEEREQVKELATRMGGVSLSDCVRAATLLYRKLRLDRPYRDKHWPEFYFELVRRGEIHEMGLGAELPKPRAHRSAQ